MLSILRQTSKFILPILLLAACDADVDTPKQQTQTAIAPVQVLTLAPQPWEETISTYGQVEAAGKVDITVDFSMPVIAVNFDEGQQAKAGQVLINLDNSKRKLLLEQAQTVASDAKAQLDEARHNLNRRRDLEKQGSIAKESLDAFSIRLRRAVAQYEDTLAAVELAKKAVNEANIICPVDGIIKSRKVDPGETIMAGQILGSIDVVDRVRVITFVSEKDVNYLRIGANASLTLPGIRGKVYTAKIESIGSSADNRTGNYKIKLILQNDGLLRPGMTARIKLGSHTLTDALLVPVSSIVVRKRRRVVYLAEGDYVREVVPVLRVHMGDLLPVVDGLKAGDKLVISGLEYLIDGAPITIAQRIK